MFTTANTTTIKTKTPTVEFNQSIPDEYIERFIRYMGQGKIRVYDYQGNELKVHYE